MRKLFSMLVSLAFVAASAGAQNLLANPGFETGDFSSWTVSPSTCGSASTLSVVPSPFGSDYAASFSGMLCGISLSQSVSTTAGEVYGIQFRVRAQGSDPTGDLESQIGTVANGEGHASNNIGPSNGARLFRSFFTAGSSTTTISIYGFDTVGSLVIDDVLVTPASTLPEPSTFALFGTGLLGAIPCARRRQRLRKIVDVP